MKKILSFLSTAVLALGFTACDDVPSPFNIFDEPGEGGNNGGEVLLSADFASSLSPFQNFTTEGEGAWVIDYSTAKASGYDNTTKVTTAGTYYLVSPEIDLPAEDAHITFEYILRYNRGDENQQLLINTEYDATKPAEGWILLNQKWTEGSDWTTFSEADIAIPAEYQGKTVRLALRYNTDATSGSTWEVKNFKVLKGTAGGGGEEKPAGEPKGDGTLENPYNPAGVIAYVETLGADTNSPNEVYVKGKVVSIKENYDNSFGNATFDIAEEGAEATTFTVYRALYLGNKTYTSGDLLKEGDEVIVYGLVVNFRGNTPETVTKQAYLYSLNGKSEGGGDNTGGGTEPTGEAAGNGSQANPYNALGASQYAASLAADTESENEVYIKGKISRIGNKGTFTEGGTFGNASFYISEDGTQNGEFYVFRTLYLGNQKYVAGQTDIKVGDEVVIYGKVVNYKGNTPETAGNKSYLVSLNGVTEATGGGDNTGGGDDQPTPATGTNLLQNGDFESWTGGLPDNWKSTTTAGNATLSQSTDAHGGSYSVKVAVAAQNKRIAYKEITLKKGTYTIQFYAKGNQVRPGYVAVVDGAVNGQYQYGGYVDLSTDTWTLVSHNFTLAAETTVNVVVMNPANRSTDVFIDDFTLTTSDGGLVN